MDNHFHFSRGSVYLLVVSFVTVVLTGVFLRSAGTPLGWSPLYMVFPYALYAARTFHKLPILVPSLIYIQLVAYLFVFSLIVRRSFSRSCWILGIAGLIHL